MKLFKYPGFFLLLLVFLLTPIQLVAQETDSKIAFSSNRDGNVEIYAMNSDGTGQTRLTHNTAYDSMPSWSPRGTKIVFTSFRDGDVNLHYLHVNKAKRGRTCRACHSTHASKHNVIIRDSVPFGRWELPINRPTLTTTPRACDIL